MISIYINESSIRYTIFCLIPVSFDNLRVININQMTDKGTDTRRLFTALSNKIQKSDLEDADNLLFDIDGT